MWVYLYTDSWRTPWANTLAYYPLTATTTVNDQSGNNYNLTNVGNITFGDNAWVSCASFNNTSRYLYTAITETSDTNLTFNIWIYLTNNRTTKDTNRIMWATYSLYSTTPPNHFIMQYSDGYPSSTKWLCGSYVNTQWWDIQYTSVDTININTWYNCCVTYDGSNIKLYVNWSLYNTKAFTKGSTYNTIKNIYINCRENDISFYGYLSNAIFEKKTRAAQEVLDYYNASKSIYGIS